MKDQRTLRFSVYGAGNLGCQLIAALETKGYELAFVYKKSKNLRFNHAVATDSRRIVAESDIIFISVQESHMRDVAEHIAANSEPGGKYFFHTSNSLTSEELISIKKKGGFTASFSPLQSFAGTEPLQEGTIMDGVFFLVEGDAPAVAMAAQIASHLNAKIVPVEKEDKIYLHIAAVAASNFLAGILKLAERQLHRIAGKPGNSPPPIDILLPLIERTLDNVRKKGVDASLTGPVKRGESAIIEKHIAALEGDDAVLYRHLSDYLANTICR